MSNNSKISIRFFDDCEVRAIWGKKNNKWSFSVLDIVAVLTGQDDYTILHRHCEEVRRGNLLTLYRLLHYRSQ